MIYEIRFFATSKKQLQKLKDKKLRERVIAGLEYIAQYPYEGKPLKAEFKGCRSFRIGDYRIIYYIVGRTVNILYIEHRRSVYR